MLYLSHKKIEYFNKYALFDLDNTIITTASGNKFPKNLDDWKFLPGTVEKIRELSKSWRVVVITNQANQKSEKFKEKAEKILKELDVPCELYAIFEKNYLRKPNTGIIEYFIKNFEYSKLEKIFYCGDAAGRANDFSDSDRKLAFNIYLLCKAKYPKLPTSAYCSFINEKQMFSEKQKSELKNNSEELMVWRGFNPLSAKNFKPFSEYYNEIKSFISTISSVDIMIIMMGAPASGKSYLTSKLREDFSFNVVNQDILKTKEKCIKEVEKLSGSNLIIDNTNPSAKTRSEYFSINPNSRKIIILFDLSRDFVQHLNIFRERKNKGKRIPEIAYRIYYKNLQKPEENASYKLFIVNDYLPELSLNDKLYFMQKS